VQLKLIYYFEYCRSYTRPDASTGLMSSIYSAPVARIKSQGYLKQGSKFETALEIALVNTRCVSMPYVANDP
jgi:hypothetical protein